MTAELHQFPTALTQLAQHMRDDITRINNGANEWVEGMLALAQHLVEGRDHFGNDDRRYGEWLKQENIDIGENNRAALITMGANPEKLREVLETERPGLHADTIWRKHRATFGNFPNDPKPSNISKLTGKSSGSNTKPSSSNSKANRDPDRNEKWRRKIVEDRGTDELKQILADGKLPLSTCVEVANLPPETQAAMIQTKLANPNIRSYPDRKRPSDPKPQRKLPAQPRINSPLIVGKYHNDAPLTNEEKGLPANPTTADRLRWRAKVGHLLIRPLAIEELVEDEDRTTRCVRDIASLVDKLSCTAEDFFRRIDKMLAHVPTPERGRGTEIDFAKKARASLKSLEDNLTAARERLEQFEVALAKRKEPH